MGDYFQRIVDVEADEQEAGPLAGRMVDWLVSEGVITRETSGEGVYSQTADEGYVPGPRWDRAVVGSAETTWQPGPVAVMVGRDYYVGGQGQDEADSASCPRCDATTVIIDYPEEFEADDEVWRPYREAIAVWKETGEGGSVACSACAAAVPVTEWRFGSGFALGALAFDFWGWPPLDDAFLAEFSRQLGHSAEEQMGKF
ncbi:hypothetical protein ACH4U7_31085 [Streptomyces sp. NPDC020845]|uniref:hypothetical protein n=1 Tax=Streptomyces sp. NPDC020845 TaxID=3365096 RepID=UPI00379BB0AE